MKAFATTKVRSAFFFEREFRVRLELTSRHPLTDKLASQHLRRNTPPQTGRRVIKAARDHAVFENNGEPL